MTDEDRKAHEVEELERLQKAQETQDKIEQKIVEEKTRIVTVEEKGEKADVESK